MRTTGVKTGPWYCADSNDTWFTSPPALTVAPGNKFGYNSLMVVLMTVRFWHTCVLHQNRTQKVPVELSNTELCNASADENGTQ
jgi:hypothetical protein